MTSGLKDLAARLAGEDLARFVVVSLPDFFLDHVVACPPWTDAVARMAAVHERGGGNVPGWPQRLQPGGNAANAAMALARLGVTSHLVTVTDAFGLDYLRKHAPGVRLEARGDGELAVTTALEFGADRRNVMLSWPGSVARLRFADLDENQRTAVAGADAVVAANWALNSVGTDFVADVLRHAGARTLTYVDTADPSHRLQDVPELRRRVLASPELDVLALNENELRLYSGETDLAAGLARLRSDVAAVVDVHTGSEARSAGPAGKARAPTFRVAARRATGAGDAWNAGNVVGHLLGLEPGDRLALANAVAALYVASPDAVHPRLADVVGFLAAEPALAR